MWGFVHHRFSCLLSLLESFRRKTNTKPKNHCILEDRQHRATFVTLLTMIVFLRSFVYETLYLHYIFFSSNGFSEKFTCNVSYTKFWPLALLSSSRDCQYSYWFLVSFVEGTRNSRNDEVFQWPSYKFLKFRNFVCLNP